MHYFTWENVLDFIKNTNLYRTFQTDLYCIASCKQIRDGSWHWEKLRVWSVWWIVFLKVLYTLNCILYVTKSWPTNELQVLHVILKQHVVNWHCDVERCQSAIFGTYCVILPLTVWYCSGSCYYAIHCIVFWCRTLICAGFFDALWYISKCMVAEETANVSRCAENFSLF